MPFLADNPPITDEEALAYCGVDLDAKAETYGNYSGDEKIAWIVERDENGDASGVSREIGDVELARLHQLPHDLLYNARTAQRLLDRGEHSFGNDPDGNDIREGQYWIDMLIRWCEPWQKRPGLSYFISACGAIGYDMTDEALELLGPARFTREAEDVPDLDRLAREDFGHERWDEDSASQFHFWMHNDYHADVHARNTVLYPNGTIAAYICNHDFGGFTLTDKEVADGWTVVPGLVRSND